MKDIAKNKTMTSLEIADLTGKRHDQAVRVIKDMQKQSLISPPQIVEERTDAGRMTYHYLFSGEAGKRDSLILVARLSPRFMCKIVDRWMELESGYAAAKMEWDINRSFCRMGYKLLCKAVEQAHEEPKFFHYSNEADLINRIVLGMSAKRYKETNQGKSSIRNSADINVLYYINRLQAENERLIISGYQFKERKGMLRKLLSRITGETSIKDKKASLTLVVNNLGGLK